MALARHGEKALPLLQKLLGDTNPWIRAGAIATLSEIYGQKEESKEPRKITSQLDQVTAKIANLIDDPHPAPQAALGQFIAKTRLETGSTKKIILMMAASAEPSVRFQTLRMGRYWLKDKETVVEIGRLVSGAPDGNTPNHWNWAHLLLQRYKKDPICRKAIPVMAEFLYEKANVIPVRGFFSDGAQNRALDIMLTQWDREVEKMPHVVQALCRCHVRLPYSDYPGWARCRDLTKRLLEKLTAVSAPTIRECIEEEKRWLNRASKEHIFALSSKTRKNQFSQSIDELERIAKTVESGNCFKFEVPKEKEDRKGEQKEELPDLEDDLDLDL